MKSGTDQPTRVFYAKALYGREEIDAVIDVLENSPLTLMGGPAVGKFENRDHISLLEVIYGHLQKFFNFWYVF